MFVSKIKIRFNHVDVAGLIFYPRYYELLNQVIEEWFEQRLGYDFKSLIDEFGIGMPAVDIKTSFPNPTVLGEVLEFYIELRKLGSSSICLNVAAKLDGQIRFIADATLVCAEFPDDGKVQPTEIPPLLRAALEREKSADDKHTN